MKPLRGHALIRRRAGFSFHVPGSPTPSGPPQYLGCSSGSEAGGDEGRRRGDGEGEVEAQQTDVPCWSAEELLYDPDLVPGVTTGEHVIEFYGKYGQDRYGWVQCM
jgi:hypothetical protein